MYLSPNGDGMTEKMGPGWKDERRWIVTVLDPFDLVGLVKGRDRKVGKFWEEEEEEEVQRGQELELEGQRRREAENGRVREC